jgi:glycosyltransferase involved in cell wall biosynthesis
MHSSFARAIGAEFFHANRLAGWMKTQWVGLHRKFLDIVVQSFQLPRGYNIHFCEGTFTVSVVARKLRLQKPKIIAMIDDPLVYFLHAEVVKGIKKSIVLNWLNEVDGFICMGKMEKKLLSKFIDGPIRMVGPFIPEKLYRRYSQISPDLNSHKILFVGKGPDWFCKGLDLLVHAFKKAKEEIEDLELKIVGNWLPQTNWLIEGVDFVGYRGNLTPYFKESSLYVHIGRGEAFGMSVLEAMLSGIPAMVSKWTGAQEVVEKLGGDFVCDIDPEQVAGNIVKYYDLSPKKRKMLSKKARVLASQYKMKEKIELFKRQFQGLLDDLELRKS